MEENSKIVIEHYKSRVDMEGRVGDLLIIRESLSNKGKVKKLVKGYIEENDGNLNFHEGKKKMKRLRFDGNRPSVYEDNTNFCFWIKDPELIKYIIANHDKDTFHLTDNAAEIEKNKTTSIAKIRAMREDSEQRWAHANRAWEGPHSWRR